MGRETQNRSLPFVPQPIVALPEPPTTSSQSWARLGPEREKEGAEGRRCPLDRPQWPVASAQRPLCPVEGALAPNFPGSLPWPACPYRAARIWAGSLLGSKPPSTLTSQGCPCRAPGGTHWGTKMHRCRQTPRSPTLNLDWTVSRRKGWAPLGFWLLHTSPPHTHTFLLL